MKLRRRYFNSLFTPFAAAMAFAAALVAGAAFAQHALPPGVQQITDVEGITEYRLANGLQVLLFPDASKPTTTVNITYRVGSRHENYGETGMAHLLEHLLFKGTPTRTTLWKDMSDRGFNNNGTTWVDRTNYYESFATNSEHLKWAIEMEADRMVNSRVSAEDLKSEMTVVRNEYEMGENNPWGVLMKRMGSVAYDWHAYGKSTIGNKSDIENVRIENLQQFYKLYYQPDNATLLIGGKFDVSQTLQWIAAAFGAIPKPTRVLPTLWTTEPTQDGERSFTVRRSGDVQLLLAGFKVPSGVHADSAPLRVLAHVLGDDASGRLKKSLIDSEQATEIFSFSFATFDPGMLFAGATLRTQQDLSRATETLMGELSNVQNVTAAEVVRAQNALVKDADETVRAPDQLSVALSEAIAQGDWRLFFFQRDLLKKVTAADVARVAKTYLKRDNRTIGTFIPTSAPERVEIAARPDVVALLKDYKGDTTVSVGEQFDPTPANIDARTQRFTLANGMQVALLPKGTRGGAVVLSMRLRAGSLETLRGKGGARQMADGMMMRGTSKLSREQIKDQFDALKTSVSISTSGANLSTIRPQLKAAIALAAQVMKDANFPPDEFGKLRQETLSGLEFGRREPQTLATDKLAQHLRQFDADDVRTRLTSTETIQRVEDTTRDQAFAFYKNFVGAAGGQIAVVGDFDAAEVKAQLEAEFGAWNASEKFTRYANKANTPKPGEFTINAPDNENGTLLAALPLALNDTHPDYAAITIANYIFGGNAGSRLFARVREKEGLSYAVGTQLDIPSFEPAGSFLIYAIAAPANMGKVQALTKDELVKVLREGFSADEVAKAKTAWLAERNALRAEDSAVAGSWLTLLFNNRSFAFSQRNDESVAALTAEAISAAFRKHIDPAKMVFVRALDETKVK